MTRKSTNSTRNPELIKQLDDLFPGGRRIAFERKNIVKLLQCLLDDISPKTDFLIGTLDDGSEIFSAHPAMTLLARTIDAFKDLDFARTADVFKPYAFGAGATLPLAQRGQLHALTEALFIIQRSKNVRSFMQAAEILEKMLRKAGIKDHKGHFYTKDFLRRLPHRKAKTVR